LNVMDVNVEDGLFRVASLACLSYW
jgi:hypothetical protein